jgi:sugar transferase EpsL
MKTRLKRTLDVVLSGTMMVLLAPLFALVALAIRVKMDRPVLFRHKRPGYRAELFTLYKFRTMTNARDSDGSLLADSDRVTTLGRFLRRWSLDELPQLWNVLRGDMSLVGPRPLLVEYLGKYTPEQARRHEVKPGLTGWAQLHGRQDLRFGERLKMDVWYADHWTIFLDLKLILQTLLRLRALSAVGGTPNAQNINDLDDLGWFALTEEPTGPAKRLPS